MAASLEKELPVKLMHCAPSPHLPSARGDYMEQAPAPLRKPRRGNTLYHQRSDAVNEFTER
ncbi:MULTISPECIES: hypothetical protein [unclassified Nostoc]|uniref:hypothetical protein n=1 Tax=unclassified Nostoc TaxID=2593658 RepID=UPI000B95564E|nr:hypothetical protein [Nostoc sp. 'Peltigera membranacea cyanobiont' 232]